MTPRLVAVLYFCTACGGQLDAGTDVPHGALPVDERSALVVINDGARDNWQAEYATLLAGTGQVRFVGLSVNSSTQYASIETNVGWFRQLIGAARASGLSGLPDPTASIAPRLVRPDSGVIEDTAPNHSEGARLIVELAAKYATVVHPVAIATGGALTDIADAYLLDPRLAERAVVVASLGRGDATEAQVTDPNGDIDPWATFIVTSKLRYVQMNGYYDQMLDFPDERVAELPSNALGRYMAAKRPEILDLIQACDQVSVLGAALPWFASGITRMRVDEADSTRLLPEAAGNIWHATRSDATRARDELWAKLKDPSTFGTKP